MAPKRSELTNVLAGYLPPVVWGNKPAEPEPWNRPRVSLLDHTGTPGSTGTEPHHPASARPLADLDESGPQASDWLDDDIETTFHAGPSFTEESSLDGIEPVSSRSQVSRAPAPLTRGTAASRRPPLTSSASFRPQTRTPRPASFLAGELITPAPQRPMDRRTGTGTGSSSTMSRPARSGLGPVLATTSVFMGVCAVGFLAVTAYHHFSDPRSGAPLVERQAASAAASRGAADLRVEPLALPPPALTLPVSSTADGGPVVTAAAPTATRKKSATRSAAIGAAAVAARSSIAAGAHRKAVAPARRVVRRAVAVRPPARALRVAPRPATRPASRKSTPAGWVDPFAE
jgi:hypothetical protein